jgi:hypothetical protein
MPSNANQAEFLSSQARRADSVTAVAQRATVCQQLAQKRPERPTQERAASNTQTNGSECFASDQPGAKTRSRTRRFGSIACDCATQPTQMPGAPPAGRVAIDADTLPHVPPCYQAFPPRSLGSTS